MCFYKFLNIGRLALQIPPNYSERHCEFAILLLFFCEVRVAVRPPYEVSEFVYSCMRKGRDGN